MVIKNLLVIFQGSNMENTISTQDPNLLILFPSVLSDKISLAEFLEASKRLANLVSDLGKIFSPLSCDMTNNINKIFSSNTDPQTLYIEDLLIFEKSSGSDTVPISLLWLKRSLQFLLVFFQCLLTNPIEPDNLESVIQTAYAASLEPYHGWFTRKLFLLVKKACPGRSVVLELLKNRMDENVHVLGHLNELCISLSTNISHIDKFYEINELNSKSSVL